VAVASASDLSARGMRVFGKDKQCALSREQVEEKAQALLSRMTLEEKVFMLSGNWDVISSAIRHGTVRDVPTTTNGCPRLGVPPITFTDGPRGVTMNRSTCFPVPMARGASFDRDLERRVGEAIGKEARALGANLCACVCMNLLRHPAWGRSQETYGEDPFHVGEMGRALTEGVQEHNVMACVKHYAANSIENSRFFVDVKADKRTLREVYLPHFKKAVDAGAACVMGAYNRVNGDYCCENKTLLNDILRDEWGFEGFTISDFLGGVRSTEKAIEAGMDIEMPVPAYYGRSLLRAVQEGTVLEETVNDSVLRILRTLLVFENCPDKTDYSRELVACKEHAELAREVAEKSMVLIKNTNGVLPFGKGVRRILVVGDLAAKGVTGDKGSSKVDPPYVITLVEGLRRYFGPSVQVVHFREVELDRAAAEAGRADCVIIAVGNDAHDEGEFLLPQDDELSYADVLSKGYRNMGKPLKSILIKPLMKSAARPFLSKTSKLGGDRQSLSLKPAQIELIKRMGSINPNTVVTLTCGGMVMTREWEDYVPAILYSWYSGMEGGNALARVLFGDVNPSGKLPFTIPREEGHLPYFSSTDREITYDLYHGYTLLDKYGHEAAYPFGFGLSYTSWEYGEPQLTRTDRQVVVSVELRSTGPVAGAEVVQVYVGMKQSAVDRPKKLLKGFEKVHLEPGQSKIVSIPVEIDELRYYCSERKTWILEPGTYLFYAGSSSDDRSLRVRALEISDGDTSQTASSSGLAP